MYRCQLCGGAAPAGTRAVKVVVERRAVSYPRRPKANREVKRGRDWVRPDDPGGVGWEIGRELVTCPGCASACQSPPAATGGL